MFTIFLAFQLFKPEYLRKPLKTIIKKEATNAKVNKKSFCLKIH